MTEIEIDLAERECLAAIRAYSADPTSERLDAVTRTDSEYKRLLRCRDGLPPAFPRVGEAIHRIRTAAPLDFPGDWPFYVVSERDLPAGVVNIEGCCAFTSLWLSAHLESAIRHMGAWQGLGFATVYAACLADERFDNITELIFAKCFGTLIHECAHQIAEMPEALGTSAWPRSAADSIQAPGVAHGYDSVPTFDVSSPAAVAAQSELHGLKFVRAALHLSHRVRFHHQYQTIGLFHGSPVPRSTWPSLRDALYDECETAEAAGQSIFSAVNSLVPVAFSDAWDLAVAAAASESATLPEAV